MGLVSPEGRDGASRHRTGWSSPPPWRNGRRVAFKLQIHSGVQVRVLLAEDETFLRRLRYLEVSEKRWSGPGD